MAFKFQYLGIYIYTFLSSHLRLDIQPFCVIGRLEVKVKIYYTKVGRTLTVENPEDLNYGCIP